MLQICVNDIGNNEKKIWRKDSSATYEVDIEENQVRGKNYWARIIYPSNLMVYIKYSTSKYLFHSFILSGSFMFSKQRSMWSPIWMRQRRVCWICSSCVRLSLGLSRVFSALFIGLIFSLHWKIEKNWWIRNLNKYISKRKSNCIWPCFLQSLYILLLCRRTGDNHGTPSSRTESLGISVPL